MGVVTVRPNNPSNTHELSLSGLGRTYGLKLERGAKSILESPLSPSNVEKTGGVKKFGDFDPAFAHLEMRTWEGGRGSEFLSDDPSKYFDGYGWSLTPGMWHQAPQWWYGEFQGPTSAASTVAAPEAADNFMPGALRSSAGYNMLWYSMASTTHLARSFPQQGSSYIMTRSQMWVRKIGTPPAPLNSRLVSSESDGTTDRPASSISAGTTAQLAAADVDPLESFVWTAAYTTASTQSASTAARWWLEVWTSVAGTDANHWEIGYNTSAGVGSTVMSGTGTSGTWAAATTANFYFRVGSARVDRKWHFFTLDRAMYAIEEKATGTTGTKLFINGDRGYASTGATANTTAVLNDGQKVWAANRWTGATVAIVRATAGVGQTALISGNTSTSLSCTFAIAPSTDAQYVIYDTNEFTQITSAIVDSSLGDNPVRDVTVVGNITYVAFGVSTDIGILQWATSIHQTDKSTAIAASSRADLIYAFPDPVAGQQIWRAISSNSQISRASTQGFTTHITFSSGISVGSPDYQFTNFVGYNDQLYVFKEDGMYLVKNDRVGKINVGLEAFPSSNNGRAVAAQNLFLYFGWSHSLERMYSGTVDDIGPWQGAGLKRGYKGPFSDVEPYIAWTLGSIDGGSTGRSAAMAWNGRGWHEFFRAPSTGYRLQSMYMQNNEGASPRLWMSVGGELICQRWPKDTLNPRNDGDVRYQHEALIETGTIDMDAVQLPKLFSRVYAITRNLASTQAQIYTEYQLDDAIGSTAWLPIGKFSKSPVDSLRIRRGNKNSLRLRHRALTQNSTVHSELHAITVKAIARMPVRRQWTIRAVTGDFQVDRQGLEDADPDEFFLWLQDVSISAEPLLMRSAWESMDDVYVVAEHPTLQREYTTPDGLWGGSLSITIREIED